MTAYEIMDFGARWATWGRTVRDCYYATHNVTDSADWQESLVLLENTLTAWGIMEEAIKKPPHLSVTGVEEGGYERL